jgi:prepilin-type N-terminal cleavage/methylation domain-containing protein
MKTKNGFTLVELIVTIGILALLASLLLPVIGRAKTRAYNTVCLSQLHQLGVAARLYAMDHEGKLPAAASLAAQANNPAFPLPRICDALSPYLSRAANDTNNTSVLKCPSDREGFYDTDGSSYRWNTYCNNAQIDATPSGGHFVGGGRGGGGGGGLAHGVDGTVIMLTDFDDFHPRPPKDGKNAVYGDGHVDVFTLPPLRELEQQ